MRAVSGGAFRALALRTVAGSKHGPLQYDLHTHSKISDGTTSPTEIAQAVSKLGLGGFALTDHDTAAGWPEARRAAAKFSIDFLPGMEITTKYRNRSTHLLVYGLDPREVDLVHELELIQRSRASRAEEMVERLRADFQITWDEVASGTTESIGRPHIADALVRRGYVADRNEAFERLLGPGSMYYVPTYAPETTHAIDLARRAGGAPVLAHPAAIRHQQVVSSAEIGTLAEAGLVGIELAHPENLQDRVPELTWAAHKYQLLITGASDYHGAGKSNQLGECSTPKQIVDQLRELMRVKR